MHWYVCRCMSGCEIEIVRKLGAHQAYTPRMSQRRRRRGNYDEQVIVAAYLGYVFLKALPTEFEVRRLEHYWGAVQIGDEAARISDDDIDKIKIMENGWMKPEKRRMHSFVIGDLVEVISGNWAGYRGKINNIHGDDIMVDTDDAAWPFPTRPEELQKVEAPARMSTLP